MKIEGLEEIQNKIFSHPGKIIYDEWTNLKNTFIGIYQANRKTILDYLMEPSQNDKLSIELVQNVRPPVVREKYTNEVLRHLYNYLSSLATLVGYSMSLTNKYDNSLLGEFVIKKNKLINSDQNNFMGELRNYVVHNDLPPLSWEIKIKDEGFNKCTYRLDSRELLRWKGWNDKSRNFIKNERNYIELASLIEDHGKKIDEEFRILFDQFPKLHSEDLDEVNELIKLRNDILARKQKISKDPSPR